VICEGSIVSTVLPMLQNFSALCTATEETVSITK